MSQLNQAPEIPLRRYFDLTTSEFTQYAHKEKEFLDASVSSMKTDYLRLKSRRENNENNGQDALIAQHIPQNELLTGIEHYLRRLQIPETENCLWIRRLIERKITL